MACIGFGYMFARDLGQVAVIGDRGSGLGKQWWVRTWMSELENLLRLPCYDFGHWINLEEAQRLFLEPIWTPLIALHVTKLIDLVERVLFMLPRIRLRPTEY
jgi:hypothetical protein